VSTDLLRRYGRSLRGTRLHDHTPCSHWQTHTVIAALRPQALTAAGVFDGPIDSTSFLAYVEQILVPTLQPGDVVILDNLAVHKQPEVRAAVEGVGAMLRFLPPLQPRLQSDRAGLCQAEGTAPGPQAALLRRRQYLRRPSHAAL